MESLPRTSKAGPWIRLAARFVDGLVLLVPTLILTVPISGGFQIGSKNDDASQALATCLGALLAYGYFVISESARGTTVGKAAFGIEVRAADGKPSAAQSGKRNAFMLLAIVPGAIGGYLNLIVGIAIGVSISRDPLGRGLHDRWAGIVLDRE